MPTLEFAGLVTAYVVIAVLLLSLNLYSRWSWWIKLATNLIVAAFFWVTYTSIPQLLGWPTEQSLPSRFYVHAINIDEPDKVYVWGSDMDRGLGHAVPRSFALPYDKGLHERADIAARKLRRGLPVIGEMGNPAALSNTQQLDGAAPTQTNATGVVFIDAPQALIPDKR